jgi:hypothetical protein
MLGVYLVHVSASKVTLLTEVLKILFIPSFHTSHTHMLPVLYLHAIL